ncbi:rho guanine nucleotide exchange factor [Diplodia corticola]|uniref:Rho guanine nucleotide exchange factor n=1 Tax=Diplodia corticola TaxID=236234 RepID=A0A1J9S551_9PEZI|nr:rho guanine nucleotide exchange factor [Diplodia corticola]OJD34749.1 rho guanine nucleotide exchange factor [Diplodia corticola]
MRHSAARPLLARLAPPLPVYRRLPCAYYSSASGDAAASPATSLSPRWLSDIKSRIGKCITFGLQPEQTDAAGSMLKELARDWRELVAGSEGFLTEKSRRGLYRQEVVWGEMVRHVNNVVYNRYAESARVNWGLNFANVHDPAHRKEWGEIMTPKADGLILRSIRTDYKFPMTYPDRVTVLHKLRSEPTDETDSFILDVVVLSERHRRPAARCVEDIVVYDYQRGKKTPLKPFMLRQFRETFALQEAAKKKYSERVALLSEQVRALETSSWDQPDAKEDFGSASA